MKQQIDGMRKPKVIKFDIRNNKGDESSDNEEMLINPAKHVISNDHKQHMTSNEIRNKQLRSNWAATTNVPYVIGAADADNNQGIFDKILLGLSWLIMIIFFPFSLFITLKVVQEYERAVIFRLGRLVKGGAKGPGLFLILPCVESYTKVDMRTVSFDVPPQEVLTKDSVTVAVDAVVYYRVFNPVISIANVENSQESTRLLAQTSLRNVLGTNTLAEILSNREAVSKAIREILDDATDDWGIKVERVEIKDVRLPIQLQRAMAAEAEATREARAKVIAAEGEQKASKALRNAAETLKESSISIQLRYLQTLQNIAAEKNSTIIFPVPIEMMSNFMTRTSKKNTAEEKNITQEEEMIDLPFNSSNKEKLRKKSQSPQRDKFAEEI